MILVLAALAFAFQQPVPQRMAVEQLDNGLRFRVDEIPSASHVSVLLGVHIGNQHRPGADRGMTQLYASALDASLHRAADRQAEVQVRGTSLLVFQTIPRESLVEVLASLHYLFARPLPLDEDGFAIARARARLAADDASHVFPGPILVDRARRLLMNGEQSVAPTPEEIHGLSRVDFKQWQARSLRIQDSFVFLMGGVAGDDGARLIGQYFAELATRAQVGGAVAEDSAATATALPPLDSSHRRVLAPFVSLAVPAPQGGGADSLAFAVGMGVLAQRAAFEFESYRAGEARAGFPFVDYNFAEQAAVGLINRRGFNGDKTAQVIAEIRGLIAPILEYGLSREEVQRAAGSRAAGLRLPPYPRATQQAMKRQWRMLYTKAQVLAAYEISAWPSDLCERLENVQVDEVNRVLRLQLAPERSLWLSLEPALRSAPPVSGR